MSDNEFVVAGGAVVRRETGEVVRLDDPAEVAAAVAALKKVEAQLREVQRTLTGALVEHVRTAGTGKTFRTGGHTVTVSGGPTNRYDPVVLEEGLRAAGMPEERINEIVKTKVDVVVDAVEAKRAASMNEAYADALARATRTEDRPWSASVK